MKKDDNVIAVPLSEEILTQEDEILVLAELSRDEKYMSVLKRVARRFADNLSKSAFRLKAESPNFAILHTRYFEQAVGMQFLISLIEKAAKKVDKM
jgi:hypothetical protein